MPWERMLIYFGETGEIVARAGLSGLAFPTILAR
jgi:hypothetical protein